MVNQKQPDYDNIPKYAIPVGVVAFGLFMGGTLTQGIYAGILTCAGFWILLEKMRKNYPSVYNWILDHSVEADIAVSLTAAFILGFTVTGIIGAAVVNLLVSIMLDHYRDNVGKVNSAKSAEASDVIGLAIKTTKSTFVLLKESLQKAKQEFKPENNEVEIKEVAYAS